jgi:hypothetical protein
MGGVNDYKLRHWRRDAAHRKFAAWYAFLLRLEAGQWSHDCPGLAPMGPHFRRFAGLFKLWRSTTVVYCIGTFIALERIIKTCY